MQRSRKRVAKISAEIRAKRWTSFSFPRSPTMEDPLSRLHMVDLYFTWTDEAALTMLQILVLRAGMYFGTQACNDTLLKASGKRWRRLRALARDGKATEAMRIEWGPPTIQVFGLEWVECKFATLDGIDFSTLTSIELFVGCFLSP